MLGLVGNDVVDLTLEGSVQKFQDRRFLERVFTWEERQIIHSADYPDVVLWGFWAAKEASFKLIKKLNDGVVFSPQNIVVQGNPETDPTGQAILGPYVVAVTWTGGVGWVHALATQPTRSSNCLFRVESRPSQQNFEQSFSESAEVRALAQRLLAEIGWPSTRIERARRPDGRLQWPTVFAGSTGLPVDVSLSHDGSYLAAAISYRSE